MSSAKRIWMILKSLVTVLSAILIALQPSDGYLLVVLILDISLLIYGFHHLNYYFRLARFMVGGKRTLYKSLIVIDLGLFVLGLRSMPQKYVMLYLIVTLAFSGILDAIDAIGARKLGAAAWKFKFSYGLVKFILAVAAAFHLNSAELAAYIYSAGLISSAFSDIITAFRKTAIVYIE